VPGEVDADREKIEELTAIIESVRQRVRSRYPQPEDASNGTDASGVRIALADLMPIVHARDAAQAKIASIGSVNPRRGGLGSRITVHWIKETVKGKAGKKRARRG